MPPLGVINNIWLPELTFNILLINSKIVNKSIKNSKKTKISSSSFSNKKKTTTFVQYFNMATSMAAKSMYKNICIDKISFFVEHGICPVQFFSIFYQF